MSNALIARASDHVEASGTASVTAGAAQTEFPVTNINDGKSYSVCRSTGTTISVRLTFGAAQALQAVAVINTNATALQLTNGAGLNVAIAVPTVPEDGLPLDPWIDLRGLALTSSTTWTLALTGPSGVGLGEFVLVATLRDLDFLMGSVRAPEDHPSIRHETDYGVAINYGMGVRRRQFSGTVMKRTLESDTLSLGRDLRGSLKNALLIPDDTVNNAMIVELLNALEIQYGEPSVMSVELQFLERQKGLAL